MTTVAQKILHLLSLSDRPLRPCEIAQETKIKANQVRARLTELRRADKVRRDFPGHYMCDPRYGVGRSLPRVQNLQVQAGVPVRLEHKGRPGRGHVERIVWGDLSITIQFGFKNQQVNYYVGAPRGLDLDGYRLCQTVVEERLARMGYLAPPRGDWMVIRYELLFDHQSVVLEGVKCLTWKDLEGTLEKYYNKDEGMRREIRSSKPTSVRDLEALIQGGVTANTVLQGLNVLRSDVSSLVDVVKGIQYSYREMLEMFKADHDAVIRLVDAVEKLVDKE